MTIIELKNFIPDFWRIQISSWIEKMLHVQLLFDVTMLKRKTLENIVRDIMV